MDLGQLGFLGLLLTWGCILRELRIHNSALHSQLLHPLHFQNSGGDLQEKSWMPQQDGEHKAPRICCALSWDPAGIPGPTGVPSSGDTGTVRCWRGRNPGLFAGCDEAAGLWRSALARGISSEAAASPSRALLPSCSILVSLILGGGTGMLGGMFVPPSLHSEDAEVTTGHWDSFWCFFWGAFFASSQI